MSRALHSFLLVHLLTWCSLFVFSPGVHAQLSCEDNPCQHDGVCSTISEAPFYSCACVNNWSGPQCEIGGPCASNPCQNGGTCDAGPYPNGYQCTCLNGWSGDSCEISPCDANPCHNDGTCAPDSFAVGGYTCTCPGAYSGPTCDVSICESNPCLHSGSCFTRLEAPFYECNCAQGYSGVNCEVSPCDSTPCENGGTCSTSGNFPYYLCACTDGFYGATCEMDACQFFQPCMFGAQCSRNLESMPYYTCGCQNGYTGQNCEMTPCASNTCQNGATCVQNGVAPLYYSCTCPDGFTGQMCESVDYCSSVTCQNGGTCAGVDGVGICRCANGYRGSSCDLAACDVNACTVGSTCLADTAALGNNSLLVVTYNSGATPPFSINGFPAPDVLTLRWGSTYYFDVTSLDSSTAVIIKDRVTTPQYGVVFKFTPTRGGTQDSAGTLLQRASNTNHQVVIGITPGYDCNCTAGHTLEFCQQTCTSGTYAIGGVDSFYPCSNCVAGTFNNASASSGCMQCDVGTYNTLPQSTICTTCTLGTYNTVPGSTSCPLQSCSPNPCQNGGTCTPISYSPWRTCSCPVGWIGADCSVESCGGAPCQNGGTCVDRGNGPVCACPMGSYGQFCTQTVCDVNTDNVCFNGGTCVPTYGAFGNNTLITVTWDNTNSRFLLNGVAVMPTHFVHRAYYYFDTTALTVNQRFSLRESTSINDAGGLVYLPPTQGVVVRWQAQGYVQIEQPVPGPANIWRTTSINAHMSTGYSLSVGPENQCMCPLGYYGNCASPCTPSYYSAGGNVSGCSTCTAGKFSNTTAASSCTNCDIGSYSFSGETACTHCSPGTYNTAPGSTSCDKNVCSPNPCAPHGVCSINSTTGDYKCGCTGGYSGVNCTVDPCGTSPCKHGGVCSLAGGFPYYSCVCPDGYSGADCSVDSCSPNPCSNGGTCSHNSTDPFYSCACPSMYAGATCGTALCALACQNGGTCVDYGYGQVCQCPSSFTGRLCESDYCANNMCSTGGTCEGRTSMSFSGNNTIFVITKVDSKWFYNGIDVVTQGGSRPIYALWNTYYFDLRALSPADAFYITQGFNGPLYFPPSYGSIIAWTAVASIANPNAFTIINVFDVGFMGTSVGPYYLCSCSGGYYGTSCNAMCGNGYAAPAGVNPSCNQCASGKYSNTTLASSCTDCPVNTYRYFAGGTVCDNCLPGTWTSHAGSFNCDLTVCDGSPCKNGGTCNLNSTSPTLYTCSCSPGFHGQNCTDTCPFECQNGGSCMDYGKGPVCGCANGYTGVYCELTQCAWSVCSVNGTVSCIPSTTVLGNNSLIQVTFNTTDGTFYFNGAKYPNLPTLAQNATVIFNTTSLTAAHPFGLAYSTANGIKYFDPVYGVVFPWVAWSWVGVIRQSSVAAYADYGTTSEGFDVDPGFRCNCTAGYGDWFCSACADGYSSSTGVFQSCRTCGSGLYSNMSTNHLCQQCPIGYYAPLPGGKTSCTQCNPGTSTTSTGMTFCNLNACNAFPCQNGGTCSIGASSPYYTCACKGGYSGVNCTVHVCSTLAPCLNGGTCSAAATAPYYSCACNANFTGSVCDKPTCNSISCYHGGRCIDYGQGPMCACANGYKGLNCESTICVNSMCNSNNTISCAPDTKALGNNSVLTVAYNSSDSEYYFNGAKYPTLPILAEGISVTFNLTTVNYANRFNLQYQSYPSVPYFDPANNTVFRWTAWYIQDFFTPNNGQVCYAPNRCFTVNPGYSCNCTSGYKDWLCNQGCDPGSSNSGGVLTPCSFCPAGTYNNATGGLCQSCAVNTTSNGGGTKCNPCFPGWWNTQTGMSGCDHNACESFPCQNLGSCLINGTSPSLYTCQCPYLFTGDTCGTRRAPMVTAIVPSYTPVSQSMSYPITIQGSYFGTNQAVLSPIYLTGTDGQPHVCTSAVLVSDSSIRCTMTNVTAPFNQSLSFSVSGVATQSVSQSPLVMAYPPAVISSVSPAFIPLNSTSVALTLSGSDFYLADALKVQFKSDAYPSTFMTCVNVTVVSTIEAYCIAMFPQNTTSLSSFSVATAGLPDLHPPVVSVSAIHMPTVTQVYPLSIPLQSNGTVVTLTGSEFQTGYTTVNYTMTHANGTNVTMACAPLNILSTSQLTCLVGATDPSVTSVSFSVAVSNVPSYTPSEALVSTVITPLPSPVVTGVYPYYLPVNATQVVITVTGVNFGATAAVLQNVTYTVASSNETHACGDIVWVSPTQLTCVVSTSTVPVGDPITVTVSTFQQHSSSSNSTQITPQPLAVVQNAYPYYVPAESTPVITLVGSNFGGSESDVRNVTLTIYNGSTVLDVIVLPPSSIEYINSSAITVVVPVTSVPVGTTFNVSVAVNVGGQASSAGVISLTPVMQPDVQGYYPSVTPISSAGTTTGGTAMVTIVGDNFGSTADTLDGVTYTVLLPNNTTYTGVATNVTFVNSHEIVFVYTAPPGLNVTQELLQNTTFNVVVGGFSSTANVIGPSSNSNSPDEPGTAVAPAPVVTAIYPAIFPMQPQVLNVTLTGSNFGHSAADLVNITYTVGGITGVCTDVTYVSSSQVVCTTMTPTLNGSSDGAVFSVNTAGQTSQASVNATSTPIPPPMVDTITPISVAPDGTLVVIVHGSDFPTTEALVETMSIVFHAVANTSQSVQCVNISVFSSSSLTCTIASASAIGLPDTDHAVGVVVPVETIVSFGGIVAGSPPTTVANMYPPPVLTSVNPSGLPLDGSTVHVTITGDHFGMSQADVANVTYYVRASGVIVGGPYVASNVTYINSTVLTADVPIAMLSEFPTSTDLLYSVEIGDYTSVPFGYPIIPQQSPSVESIVPTAVAPDGSLAVIIHGTDFPTTTPFNNSVVVTLVAVGNASASAPCVNLTVWNSTTISCVVTSVSSLGLPATDQAAGVVIPVEAVVSIGGVELTTSTPLPVSNLYPPPAIQTVTPVESSANATWVQVTLTGVNFGFSQADVTNVTYYVQVDGVVVAGPFVASNPMYVNSTAITAVVSTLPMDGLTDAQLVYSVAIGDLSSNVFVSAVATSSSSSSSSSSSTAGEDYSSSSSSTGSTDSSSSSSSSSTGGEDYSSSSSVDNSSSSSTAEESSSSSSSTAEESSSSSSADSSSSSSSVEPADSSSSSSSTGNTDSSSSSSSSTGSMDSSSSSSSSSTGSVDSSSSSYYYTPTGVCVNVTVSGCIFSVCNDTSIVNPDSQELCSCVFCMQSQCQTISTSCTTFNFTQTFSTIPQGGDSSSSSTAGSGDSSPPTTESSSSSSSSTGTTESSSSSSSSDGSVNPGDSSSSSSSSSSSTAPSESSSSTSSHSSSSSTGAAPLPPSEQSSSATDLGMILGIVFGVLGGLLLIGGGYYYYRKWKARKLAEEEALKKKLEPYQSSSVAYDAETSTTRLKPRGSSTSTTKAPKRSAQINPIEPSVSMSNMSRLDKNVRLDIGDAIIRPSKK